MIADNEHVIGKIENQVKFRVERQALRYPFVASVELVDLQSDVQLQRAGHRP